MNHVFGFVPTGRQFARYALMTALAAMFVVFGHSTAFAQSVIQGRVTDESGNKLGGVTVRIKGGTRGAVTKKDGAYSIQVGAGEKVLTFSLLGYARKEVNIGEKTTVDVVLNLESQLLDEVVVVGYGSSSKRDLTGNITKVASADIQDIPVPTLDAAIQGKAAGVVVTQGSGKLGNAVQIRVRGAASVSGSNEPLYVLDGIILTPFSATLTPTNPLVDLNPQDIESIDVLKDAAAAAIYGSRGADGGVVITTKKGNVGRTNVNVSLQSGFSNPTKQVEFLNGQQYVDYLLLSGAGADRNRARLGIAVTPANSRVGFVRSFLNDQSLGAIPATGTIDPSRVPNQNWSELIFPSNVPTNQIDVNINGGNEKTTFYASGQYFEQTGTVVGNKMDRFTTRLNVEHKVSDIFKAGFNFSLARTFNDRLAADNAFSNPIQAVAIPSITPAINPATGLPIGATAEDLDYPLYYNPFLGIGNSYRRTTIIRNLGTFFGELQVVEGLKFRTEIGFDIMNQNDDQYFNSVTRRNNGTAPLGSGSFSTQRIENINVNSFFSYLNTFDEARHVLDLTAGMSYQKQNTIGNTVSGQDFPSDEFKKLTAAARITAGSSTETEFSFLSYFARANYKFLDRYLISVSGRIDGSSRFGADNRYGFFPAASVGWVISQEDFLKNVEFLSYLKLRASYGRTGNAEIGNFASRGLFTGAQATASYNGNPGIVPSQLANPSLTWETNDQVDVGVDFSLFSNTITVELAYYNKLSKGLLLNVNVPATTGFSTIVRNVGNMTNSGFEFAVTADVFKTDDFSWRMNVNGATLNNEVTNLQGQIIEGAFTMSRAMEGQPLGVFFTPEYAGVDPSNGNALWYRNTLLADGSDRTVDSVYSRVQRVAAGNPIPSFTGGFTNTFRYKGLELSVSFNGVFGNKLNWYGVGRFSSANALFEDNQTVDQLNSWTPTNRNTNIPEARYLTNNGSQQSTRYIIDGSFIRLRNATLSYNLPKEWISDLGVNNVRVFVTGLNLLTFTKYVGWDPEVNSDFAVTNISQGVDFYTPPQARTFMFGINVGF